MFSFFKNAFTAATPLPESKNFVEVTQANVHDLKFEKPQIYYSLMEPILLEKTVRLHSRCTFAGNGHTITSTKQETFISTKTNFPAITNVHVVTNNCAFVAVECNYIYLQNVHADGGYMSLDGCWDTKAYSVFLQRSKNTALQISGATRYSNPHTFHDLHIESWNVEKRAIHISNAANLEFHSIKIHGIKEEECTKPSIFYENVTPTVFHGGKFMFNPKGHFETPTNQHVVSKIVMYSPIIDRSDSLRYPYVLVQNAILNNRG